MIDTTDDDLICFDGIKTDTTRDDLMETVSTTIQHFMMIFDTI
jgi:hypothetical protein